VTDADLVALSFFTPAASRALALADYFRAQGKTVVAGGIFPSLMPEVCAAHFDSVVLGEGEPVWRRLLADFGAGKLAPRYQAETSCVLATLPLPRIDLYLDREGDGFSPDDYPVQMSRGCALSCQACALPMSMTRKMRDFPLDHVVGQIRQLAKRGKRACLTEDTSWFPGHSAKQLEHLFEAMIGEGLGAQISYIGISMPMILHTRPALFDLARQAGVTMFYLVGGFDPITMNAFTGRDAKALARAEEAINRAHDVGIEPYTSFLVGNDEDDVGSADRILEFAAATGIRKAEFAIMTPYPGTPAWHRLLAQDRIFDKNWSHYNDANVVFRPARMSAEQLNDSYLKLWREFYRDKAHYRQALNQAERTIQF
jgi:radical SAM superfamily enzyme YgiQ (UPF0313 family)